MVAGIRDPLPDHLARPTRLGLQTWRACVLLVPLLCLATGWAVHRGGGEAAAFFLLVLGLVLVVLTLGLALVVLVPLALYGAFAAWFALPLGLLLAWSLGRVLQGRHRGTAFPRGVLLLVAVGGVFSSVPLATLSLLLALLAFAPLAALVLLLVPPSGAFLRGWSGRRACPACRGRTEVLGTAGGAPCPRCGTRVL